MRASLSPEDQELLDRDNYAKTKMILLQGQEIAAKNAARSKAADLLAAKVRRLAAAGLTTEQIAAKIDREPRTVQRLKKRPIA